MTKKDIDIQLDEKAQLLYEQFAGIDDSDRAGENAGSEIINALGEEEKILDHYRRLLEDVAGIIAELLNSIRFASLAGESERSIRQLVSVLKKMTRAPKFDGSIQCRYRGRLNSSLDDLDNLDYELSAGTLLLNQNLSKAVAEQRGARNSALYPLSESFKIFHTMGIFNFNLNVGNGTEADFGNLAESLKILVKFYKEKDADTQGAFIVVDEHGNPDANLTLLAWTNKLKPAALQNLVNKIRPAMFGDKQIRELNRFATVYEAIFAFKKQRELLRRPAIGINNIKLLMQWEKQPMERVEANAQVSRLVLAKFGKSPQKTAEVLTSISTEGYSGIQEDILPKRLSVASDFLDLAEKEDAKDELQEKTLRNIEEGMEYLPDNIFDAITIKDGEVNSVSGDDREKKWRLHEKLLKLLEFFKRRSNIKKKVQDISSKQVEFEAGDYAVIARNFKITEVEAAHLIDLLKACFDNRGHFRRQAFEKNIPEFIQYESTVFEFLWHYLKELATRKDRVAFLNALQVLIGRLKEPQKAMEVLFNEIFRPHTIEFSDRNGLILAIILMRRYNKEQSSHIEMTPEEVLRVQSGLNEKMAETARNFIEDHSDLLIRKFRVIHERLQQTLTLTKTQRDIMSYRYLLSLERELVIFLSLVGGKTAKKLIRAITKEYGNPFSSIYQTIPNVDCLRSFLQILQVSARSLRRFKDVENIAVFDLIASREDVFLQLSKDPTYVRQVKRVMDWMH